ncbi:MAG: hypothetical protein ACOYK6_08835 [Chthoniobacterales bacterium]
MDSKNKNRGQAKNSDKSNSKERSKLKLKSFVTILSLTPIFITSLLHAAPATREPVLLIEPSFYHHPIESLIPGAKKTVIAAAWVDQTENLSSMSTETAHTDSQKATFEFLEPSWKTTQRSFMSRFVQEGRQTLSERLSLLHPRLLRDEHQVIQVAIIDSDDPLTASTILAPNFGQQFMMIFGPEMLIAIPSATRIYVFSKLASSLDALAPAIRDDYKLSSSPISLEIFELDFKLGEGGLRAVGSLESL